MGPSQPLTPPNGPLDPRIPYFEGNAGQVSQGGRYFAWYGCGGCHRAQVEAGRDLSGGGFDGVYHVIADGHPAPAPHYAERIPVEQLWQITAYVRDLTNVPPEQRRRRDLDQDGDPASAPQ